VKFFSRKNITALFFTLILFLYNISNVIIVVDFVINQDTIAKTLCVQKDNQKGCNGKCQLMKRLHINKDTSTKKAPIENTKIARIETVFIQPKNEIDISNFNTFILKKITDHQHYKILHQSYEVVTPPPVLS